MQTKGILGVVLSIAVAFTILSGSGVGPAIFGGQPAGGEASKTLGEIADDSDVDPENDDGGLSADVTGDNEPTLVGVAISGGQFAAQLVGAIALLPITLMQLGFPSWFAVPIGSVAQVIGFIGLVQFVRGTVYE